MEPPKLSKDTEFNFLNLTENKGNTIPILSLEITDNFTEKVLQKSRWLNSNVVINIKIYREEIVIQLLTIIFIEKLTMERNKNKMTKNRTSHVLQKMHLSLGLLSTLNVRL